MIFNMVGGGGAGLNLKVVGGTTQPVVPVENTVWVNTSTAINGYAFSAVAPINPVAGMVWFKTGLPTLPINVDKKNIVEIYPTVCYQYVSGAWVVKIGKAYINGAWTTIDDAIRIVDGGIHSTAVTGGWIGVAKKFYTDSAGDYKTVAADIAADASSLVVSLTGPGYYIYIGGALTVNDIDFTNLSTITFQGTVSGGNNNKVTLSVMDRNGATLIGAAVASVTALSSGTGDFATTLDVSEVSGEYALAIGLQVQNKNTIQTTVTKLVIE